MVGLKMKWFFIGLHKKIKVVFYRLRPYGLIHLSSYGIASFGFLVPNLFYYFFFFDLLVLIATQKKNIYILLFFFGRDVVFSFH
jgi:hypothetical protein